MAKRKMSWKMEVQVAGNSSDWYDNAIRLPNKKQAEAYARDLYSRWMATTAWRVKRSGDAVNYEWARVAGVDGSSVSLGLKAVDNGSQG